MVDEVQRMLEKMAPELCSYRKRRIFEKWQIDRIIEKRRRYENKLQRTHKRLSDYFLYAESERKLERLRNKRISWLGTGMEETDLLLQQNVISIYTRALHYFNDRKLLEDFAEYCMKKKCYEEMKSAFAVKCLKNITDIELWIFCAQKLWEVGDIEGSRSVFMKSVGIVPNLRVYIEFFRIECLYSQKINKINEELGVGEEDKDDIEKGEIASVVFRDMLGRFPRKELEECLKISRIVPGLEQRIGSMLEAKED